MLYNIVTALWSGASLDMENSQGVNKSRFHCKFAQLETSTLAVGTHTELGRRRLQVYVCVCVCEGWVILCLNDKLLGYVELHVSCINNELLH